MRLVVDTGPLIALSKTGHLDLLPRLFDTIVIPAAVLGEVARPGETRSGSEIATRRWIATRGVAEAARVELQKSSDIAAGEAEAILITADAPDSTVLLMDELRVCSRTSTARIPRALGGYQSAATGPGPLYSRSGAESLWTALWNLRAGRIVVLTAAPAHKCPAAPYEGAMASTSFLA